MMLKNKLLTRVLFSQTSARVHQIVSSTHNHEVTIIVSLFLFSEPGTCYDESEDCADYARDGKCTSDGLHQYGNYCKRSCGLCGE